MGVKNGTDGNPLLPWPDELLLDVAEKHFLDRLTQEEIARRVGRSRQDVSRMLRAAESKGIVQVFVAPSLPYYDLHELGRELRVRYPQMEDVIVVPGHPELLADEEHLNEEERPRLSALREGVMAKLAETMARYLSRRLSNQSVVAVGSGVVVKSAIQRIRVPTYLPGLQIAPMTGIQHGRYNPFDGNVIAADLERITGGGYVWLPAPAMVSAEAASTVSQLPLVSQALERLAKTNMVITSIGDITMKKIDRIAESGILPRIDVRRIARSYKVGKCGDRAAVGEIGSRPFRQNGEIIDDLPWRTVGLSLAEMREIVMEHKGLVVAIAGAQASRIAAMRGALEGRLINILVTDHCSARQLLEEAGNESRQGSTDSP